MPFVIQELDIAKSDVTIGCRDFQPMADRFFTHWLMRAKSDEDVESFGDAAQLGVEGVTIDPSAVTTNIVVFEVADAPALVAALAHAGVKMGALGSTTVRAVTHLDVDAEGAERAVAAVRAALASDA